MPFVYFGHILHTTVTNKFSVENVMHSMRLWKIFVNQSKKMFATFLDNCFAEWLIKPNNILSSIYLILPLIFGIFKISFELSFLQSIFVFKFCSFESTVSLRRFIKGWFDKLWIWRSLSFGVLYKYRYIYACIYHIVDVKEKTVFLNSSLVFTLFPHNNSLHWNRCIYGHVQSNFLKCCNLYLSH